MEVHGVDMHREAYRISTPVDGVEVKGFLPEGVVMEALGINRRPGHSEVYAWLEKHSAAVKAALKTKTSGGTPRAPYDRIDIAEEF